jgi:hypothetical protein
MKKKILYVLFILAFFNAKSQGNKTFFFQIDFQDFFVHDTVCLSINQYYILNKKVLTSDFSTGVTDGIVEVFHCNNGSVLIKIGKDSLKIKRLSTPIKIKVFLNGRLSKYKINLDQGRYIGFSKGKINKFVFYQSKRPFEYE